MNMANAIAMNATILVNNDDGNSTITAIKAINADTPITLSIKHVTTSKTKRTILLIKRPAF
jgi:uncharacterized protein YfdQ (DUF2303 family)